MRLTSWHVIAFEGVVLLILAVALIVRPGLAWNTSVTGQSDANAGAWVTPTAEMTQSGEEEDTAPLLLQEDGTPDGVEGAAPPAPTTATGTVTSTATSDATGTVTGDDGVSASGTPAGVETVTPDATDTATETTTASPTETVTETIDAP